MGPAAPASLPRFGLAGPHQRLALRLQRAAPARLGEGKPAKTIGVSLGKPWENHRKMVVSWDFMGFYGIYPLVMTNITIENHHLKWNCPLNIVIFPSYVKLPKGTHHVALW